MRDENNGKTWSRWAVGLLALSMGAGCGSAAEQEEAGSLAEPSAQVQQSVTSTYTLSWPSNLNATGDLCRFGDTSLGHQVGTNTRASGRLEQTLTLTGLANRRITSIRLNGSSTEFKYDDVLLLAYNKNLIMASDRRVAEYSADATSLGTRSIPYIWSNILNQLIDNQNIQDPWCSPGYSTCSVPRTQQTGTMDINIPSFREVDTEAYPSAPDTRTFRLVTIGDNDASLDCRHGPVSLSVTVTHEPTYHFVNRGTWAASTYGSARDGWYVGDFNGDARDDLFRYLPGVSGADMFLSTGTAFRYDKSWTGSGSGHAPAGWYVGDFNGDGKDDIFRYIENVARAQVLLSTGTGFSPPVTWLGWDSLGYGTARDGWYVGDFNGDGKDDIFRYVPGTSGAQVFLSTGSAFQSAGSWTPASYGDSPAGWEVGDFNGDGRDDIFRYLNDVSGADMLLSTGTSFQYDKSWTLHGSGAARDGWFTGDFDGDGRDDLFRYLPRIFAPYQTSITGAEMFLSLGYRFPLSTNDYWTLDLYGDAPGGWYVGDFNGDGRKDVARYLSSSAKTEVYLTEPK